MKKKTKSSAVMEILKKGHTVRDIKNRVAVKKQMAAGVQAEVEPKAGEFIVVEGAKSAQEIDATLNERGSRYGPFVSHAEITQSFKRTAYGFAKDNGNTFAPDQIEALDMIFHKLGRILNGDPDYADSWIDIAGYAQLVADRLEGKVR